MADTPIRDTNRTVTIRDQDIVYSGTIWDVHRDTFQFTDSDQPMTRDYVNHPGAVAIVAVDEAHRVAMINQYRHPVGQDCWEIPAGLRDEPEETLVDTAHRELIEETDLSARDWSVLVDHYPSGGSSTEAIRVFLARDLATVATDQRHQRYDEEAYMSFQWVALDQALDAVLSGAVRNGNAVAGIMAAHLVLTGTRRPRPIESAFMGQDD